ncbi:MULTISPECIES: L,D-transpeptidase family protein [unclassified Clostridium]|uniref:L,D-transpeptidase family protein n=2 Tax=Clostridium TaxID=1485 RepID=UPI002A74CFE4|nr:peptidoglycan binding domain-containing protein [Clostridium sp.]MDY2631208.1 peptidoglycan binding domain-containing protein [Clostridium sp.]MDY6226136.1 peptidoglycan binding domain-containing protein [Clostridium sp.]
MTREILNRAIKNKVIGKIFIFLFSIILIYLLCSIYFINHLFINTKVNGIDLSLRKYNEINEVFYNSINGYSINIVGRDGRSEIIDGKDIEITFNKKDIKKEIKSQQNPIMWGSSLILKKEYYIEDLIDYNKYKLDEIIDKLDILTKNIEKPINVSFKYLDGIYVIEPEVYGNKIDKEKLKKALSNSIYKGDAVINLNENQCYEEPAFTSVSEKTMETEEVLNKYISTKITYLFGENKEVLDDKIIKDWLSVNEDLDVVLDEKALNEYITSLCNKYNTVGISREFKTSTGKTIEVEGGYYGWKINSTAEKKLLNDYIKLGAIIEKEPLYSQEGLYRNEDDIGNTYVEINISRQYMWFYKEGKVIAEGGVVTGDPRKGYSTLKGTYMINYKQKDAVLRGPGYEAKVNYWMPFNGNIGIHDASWRSSFGYNIYQNNGTHGCVNSPLSLAKKIYENIEAGTPVICYEE